MRRLERNQKNTEPKEKKPNKALLFTAPVAIAGATALVLFFRCEEPMVERQMPMPYTPKNGDGVCAVESESYPYLRNSDGTVMKGKDGKPIKNPHYSKIDCHVGDNVCDNDPAKILDPAGNAVEINVTVELPLESDDLTAPNFSIDCVRIQCAQKGEEDETEGLTRPRFHGEVAEAKRKEQPLRQRSQFEVEMMHAQGKALPPGDNYFVVVSAYEETCDSEFPLCSLTSDEACFCPNHEDCIPPDCGDGTKDKGEECDPGSKKGRAACDSDEVCTKSCRCVEKGPDCGNGEVEEGEECDHASQEGIERCGEDEKCTNSCRCVPRERCGDGNVGPREECDYGSAQGKDECDDNETCNNDCECVKKKIDSCDPPPSTTNATGLMSDARAKTRERAPKIRKKLTEDNSDSVRVTITFLVDENGRTKFRGAQAKCSGTCDHETSANVKVELGELGLDGKQVATPGTPCLWKFPASASSGR